MPNVGTGETFINSFKTPSPATEQHLILHSHRPAFNSPRLESLHPLLGISHTRDLNAPVSNSQGRASDLFGCAPFKHLSITLLKKETPVGKCALPIYSNRCCSHGERGCRVSPLFGLQGARQLCPLPPLSLPKDLVIGIIKSVYSKKLPEVLTLLLDAFMLLS